MRSLANGSPNTSISSWPSRIATTWALVASANGSTSKAGCQRCRSWMVATG
jgi:hypothetical protein